MALAIDLFCGLGGWTGGLVAEGWEVIGFDIERHEYGEHRYPARLVIQDVLTLHGSQFCSADLIVASPPCQEYSYMAMPWTRAKAKAAAIRADTTGQAFEDLNRLFDACFRIQREACEAAGRHIPMVVENVRGAQKWVGRARWNYGSFYLWGDVPALMPVTRRANVGGLDWKHPDDPRHRPGQAFNTTAEAHLKSEGCGANVPGIGWTGFANPGWRDHHATKNTGGSWFNVAHNTTSGKGQNPDGRKTQGHPNICDGHDHTRHLTNPTEHEGVKQRGSGREWWGKALDERRKEATAIKNGNDWFGSGENCPLQRRHGSRSSGRKFASAMIAKIPEPLARWVARAFLPRRMPA